MVRSMYRRRPLEPLDLVLGGVSRRDKRQCAQEQRSDPAMPLTMGQNISISARFVRRNLREKNATPNSTSIKIIGADNALADARFC